MEISIIHLVGNINGYTGYDTAKWLVEKWLDGENNKMLVTVHSANPIGAANIMGYINNYYANNEMPQTCIKDIIKYTIK